MLVSCALLNSPPQASFVLIPPSGNVPLTVSFDASSSSDEGGIIVFYRWKFGDGVTGSDRIETHIYEAPGLYTVRLLVRDNLGGEDSATGTVLVDEVAVAASFSARPLSGEPPLGVDFDASNSFDLDGESITFTWDYGDGPPGVGITSRHTYYSSGIYRVLLTVTNVTGETDSTAQTIVVGTTPETPDEGNAPPSAVLVVTPDWGFVPLAVSFDASGSTDPDGSIVGYRWNFGNGEVASGVETNCTYGSPGRFVVRLMVVDNDGAFSRAAQTVDVYASAAASTTTFVNSAGEEVASYLATDRIYVKVLAADHAGATILVGAVAIPSRTFDLQPLPGAASDTFITRAISLAELGMSGGTTITARYTNPTNPSDTSSDTITVAAARSDGTSYFRGRDSHD